MLFASFLLREFVRKDAHFRRMFVSVTFWQFLFLRTTQVTMSKGLLHCSSNYSIYTYIYVASIILYCCKHEISTIRKVQPSHQITVISHKFFRNVTKSTPCEKRTIQSAAHQSSHSCTAVHATGRSPRHLPISGPCGTAVHFPRPVPTGMS